MRECQRRGSLVHLSVVAETESGCVALFHHSGCLRGVPSATDYVFGVLVVLYGGVFEPALVVVLRTGVRIGYATLVYFFYGRGSAGGVNFYLHVFGGDRSSERVGHFYFRTRGGGRVHAHTQVRHGFIFVLGLSFGPWSHPCP